MNISIAIPHPSGSADARNLAPVAKQLIATVDTALSETLGLTVANVRQQIRCDVQTKEDGVLIKLTFLQLKSTQTMPLFDIDKQVTQKIEDAIRTAGRQLFYLGTTEKAGSQSSSSGVQTEIEPKSDDSNNVYSRSGFSPQPATASSSPASHEIAASTSVKINVEQRFRTYRGTIDMLRMSLHLAELLNTSGKSAPILFRWDSEKETQLIAALGGAPIYVKLRYEADGERPWLVLIQEQTPLGVTFPLESA